MSTRTISVALEARIAGFTGPMQEAAKAAGDVAKSTEGAGKAVDKSAKDIAGSFTDMSKQIGISLDGPAGPSSKLKGLGAEWQKLQHTAATHSQEWDKVGNTMLTAGAAAGVAVGLVTREYANFDQAMSGVASTGQDAKSNIDALRETAKKLGADTAFSAVEAANGVEELARAGVSAADILDGGLSGALDLAAAGQLEVADAAGIASIAMTQFKLSGKDVPRIADLLAAGAGKAMGGVDDLGMAMKQGGLVASQFGLSIEETVGGLSAFAAQGLIGSDAGTSLKTMLLKLASPSKEAATLMRELGIDAYDATGQFVGLESLAGQLQTAFAGQSDATRDAAMATIFGTDAIRSANVLYTEGAEGIANWTAAVDDAGYAAETASTLQDNLVGDLEKLGGAWSTLAIEMGSAADGPLRAAVQGLTGIVDLAGQYPAAAQGILGVVASVSGLAIAAGLLMKGVTFVSDFKGALTTLSESSPGMGKLAGNLGKVAKAAGVAAAAVAGLQILGAVVEGLGTHGPSIDETTAAVKRLITTTEGSNALDSLFRDANDSSRDLIFGVNDLDSAVASVSSRTLPAWFENKGILNVIGGVTSDYEKLDAVFANIDQTLSSGSISDAVAGFSQIRDVFKEQGVPVEEMLALFPEYAAEIQNLAAVNGIGELSGNHLADAMEGVYPPLIAAQQAMSDATTSAAAQAGAYDEAAAAAAMEAEAQAQAAEAARDALSAHLGLRDAITAVNDAQRAAANSVMAEEQAREQWIATLQGADKQLKDNGKSLDENTEKGRANRDYLRGLATDARDVTDRMRDNGAGIDVLNGKMVEQRAQFIETAAKFGLVGDAAEQAADDYGLIPNYVETTIATAGAKLSQEEADAVNKALEDIPEELRPDIVVIANTEGAEAAQAAIDAVKGKTVTITTIMQTLQGTGYERYQEALQRRATGGRIVGPGTGTSDDVLMWGSNGEFMMRTWAAQKIGYDRMEYMNRTGELPAFAGGGRIGAGATSGAMSAPYSQSTSTATYITNVQLEGREAMRYVLDHFRDGKRRDYQERGVHG